MSSVPTKVNGIQEWPPSTLYDNWIDESDRPTLLVVSVPCMFTLKFEYVVELWQKTLSVVSSPEVDVLFDVEGSSVGSGVGNGVGVGVAVGKEGSTRNEPLI